MSDPNPTPRERSRLGEHVAIAASALAGALSLAVASYNVYLQRVQVRAQVWPHVEWTYNNTEGFEFDATNSGTGPAKIVGLRATRRGVELSSWQPVFDALEAENPGLKDDLSLTFSSVSGRVLPSGGEIPALAARLKDGPDKDKLKDVLFHALTEVRVEICYCSVLDECWMRRDFTSTPVSACPASELTFKQ